MKKKFVFLFLAVFSLASFAGTKDSDELSSDLVRATIIFKSPITVKAGPRYQSGKILWNDGPNSVRAWVLHESETELSLPAGTRAVITQVYADGFGLMGANVLATTEKGDEIAVMFQYSSVEWIGPRESAKIPKISDLKLAFDLVLP